MNLTAETIRYYRDWRFDRSCGEIRGLGEFDANQLPGDHWRLVEDSQARIIRVEEHRADQECPAMKLLRYESAESRRIVEALDQNPDGTLRLIHRYCYDEKGRMIDRLELDGQKRSRGHVESVWDEQGREVEEVVYDRIGRLQGRHRYAYDPQGRMVLEQIFAANGTLSGTRRMVYDERGRLTEKLWHDGHRLRSRFVHAYSDTDEIVRSRLYNGKGVLLTESAGPPTSEN